jgi:hypothetical protein
LHIPQKYGSDHPISFVPENFDTGESYDFQCSTYIPQQEHDFNKQFYVLTAYAEDGDGGDGGGCRQHDAMTQWRRTESGACSVKGRAAVVQEGSTGVASAAKESAVCQGSSSGGAEEGATAASVNGRLDEEVEVLLRAVCGAEAPSASGVPEATRNEGTCSMARNRGEELPHKLEDSACDDETGEGVSRRLALVHESSSVIVTKSDMDTPVVVCDGDEPDRSPRPLPNIVLDATDPPTCPEATPSHSQELRRPPTLQLRVASACSQSAARKSPVTVQEWIDSLPLNHRYVQLAPYFSLLIADFNGVILVSYGDEYEDGRLLVCCAV